MIKMSQELQEKPSIDYNKIIAHLSINSFQLLEQKEEVIYFQRNYLYWRDAGELELISKGKFFRALQEKLRREVTPNDLSSHELASRKLRQKIELDYLSDFTPSQFRMFKFLRFFGYAEKDLIENIRSIKQPLAKKLLTTADGSCGITYLSYLSHMFEDAVEVRLPRTISLLSFSEDYWFPGEKKAKKILEENHRVGYNFANLKKALRIFNYCAVGYVSQTTHLLLKNYDLVILLGSRLEL
ncbi:MAG: hypothetical protein GF308_19040 [Candidatus Heimdallarchaeota archaeon]|nr:hypothetical protein [Candidatus Heimdallarchaeota archaeon]